ncbi:MAG: GGDEF domain-containing protein [Steroidobacteraceae bacterium]
MLESKQQWTSEVAPGGASGRANARRPQRLLQNGASRRQPAESSSVQTDLVPLEDALLYLAVAEKRLLGVLHENESLRIDNAHLMESLDDASRRAVAAQRIAQHDGLTGLPNRLLLIRRLQLAIKNASRRHCQLALLFIDLDGFKAVNDRLGHAVADKLLTAVAARIAACVRRRDLACRYGGDEFVALLSNLEDATIAVRIAEAIRDHIGRLYSIDDCEINITASIGLAVYPADGESYDALLNRADAAMYHDKAIRRARSSLCETPDSANKSHWKRPNEIADAD